MIVVDRLEDILPYVENCKAVIFDLDDTLYDEKDYVRSGFAAVAKELPMISQPEEKLWRAFERKEPAIDSVLKQENIWTQELSCHCLTVYRNHKPKICLRKGTKEVLQTLRRDGKYLGIITDGRPEGQNNKIDALKITTLVDSIIITDTLGGVVFRKPNSISYEMMQERSGTNFSQMVYVGDNLAKDFIAPKTLGMMSIYFNNANGLYNR